MKKKKILLCFFSFKCESLCKIFMLSAFFFWHDSRMEHRRKFKPLNREWFSMNTFLLLFWEKSFLLKTFLPIIYHLSSEILLFLRMLSAKTYMLSNAPRQFSLTSESNVVRVNIELRRKATSSSMIKKLTSQVQITCRCKCVSHWNVTVCMLLNNSATLWSQRTHIFYVTRPILTKYFFSMNFYMKLTSWFAKTSSPMPYQKKPKRGKK